MNKVSRQHIKLTFFTLALLFVGSAAVAQSDSPYVIKRTKYNSSAGDHYLAHVKVGENYELQDATSFSPDCIWYSGRDFNVMGTHHNYYFIDDQNKYRFLSAPLAAGGSLSLSESLPEVYLLNNTDHNYYFYDWDQEQGNKPYGGGLARGHQYNGITNVTDCQACSGGQWDVDNGECWAAYWVEYNGSSWKLSTESNYHITANSGRYRLVTVTSYPMVTSNTGDGLNDLLPFNMEYPNSNGHSLSASFTGVPFMYIPAYKKYYFKEVTTPGATTPPSDPVFQEHTYYFPNDGTNTSEPITPVSSGDNPAQWSYAWSISGEGAEYLSFSQTGDFTHTSSSATPTLYYRTANNDGHKTATLMLTVTYPYGSTQTKSCTVTVKTPCQNPQFSANVSYENVVISWTQTAESYKVSYKKAIDSDWTEVSVGDVTSYTLNGLAYSTTYDYKVQATSCTTPEPTFSQFTTLAEPDAMIRGAVFGGGRMANVSGKTEVIIINTDSIGAVYGGNDIAGEVQDAAGSTIVLGVAAGDSYSTTYNSGAVSTKVRVGDVYGGGNGYYLYNANEFHGATTPSVTIPDDATVNDLDGTIVWKNETGADYALTIPKIVKTAITMTNNVVKVDSIFGGAKNAFITNTDAAANGTSITVKGGTAFAVYGGNNYGGSQAAGKHYIKVEDTKTNTNTYPTGFGRDFGIAYLFGGGNKVAGKTTEVEITGGMCDTVFGGGNAADVSASNVTINCVGPSKTFTNAVSTWSGNNINEINGNYAWNGTGIYNVRTLFGGNNRADMGIEEQVVGLPNITLTSGSVGTVYGGGNAGNMLSKTPDDADPTTNPGTGPIATDFDPPMVGSNKQPIYYGTHVVMDHANMIVDYLYGGCQMSDVDYSTWVEIKDGHVGTVYGGCNVSGDVGSEPRIEYPYYTTGEEKQLVKGGTYVKATGGTIYGDLFAGSNGFYHCNDGICYIEGHNYTSHNYIGEKIPSHNETHVKVSKDDDANTSATVKGNVYAGGNMAYVGFIVETIQNYRFREFVGFCSVRMDGGVVEGSVYGGGNRASVYGSNEVKVSGGKIGYIGDNPTDGALYGGNDRAGQVAQISNRVLSSAYDVASDQATNLKLMGVKTYVSVTGKPKVSTVYGGGNGAYTDYNSGNYCDPTDKPVQSSTFVDINIDAAGGSGTGGYINTVYGGGNGVTVLDRITVFVNVQNVPTGSNAYDQVGTIFGGNNQGDLDILADIIMLHGQVNTVYGGCNSGAMTGSHDYESYTDVGSVVQLRNQYRPNGNGDPVVPDAKVTGAVYGGCRMNNVTHNSLVIVEGGNHSTANMFGGCDISGTVSGTSQVVVKNGTATSPYNNSTVIDNAFGGGNGNYIYYNNNVYPANDVNHEHPIALGTTQHPITAPSSTTSRIDMISGTANNLYASGNACGSGSTLSYISGGTVNTGIYGGSNAKGTVTGDIEVNVTGGTIGASTSARANVHGGGYGHETHTSGNVTVNIASLNATTGPTINGDIYGGSALGQVSASGNLTQVNFYKGTVNGDVYGGGLGDGTYPAEVSGNVEVNIRGGVFNDAAGNANANDGNPSDGNTGGGCIYGCNNNNGSPKGNVTVNIYATDHGDSPATNLYPNDLEHPSNPNNITTVAQLNTNAATQTYAIKAVFGGGNLAAYEPAGDSHSATVHVYNCDNTIEDIFGGGNAANVGSGNVSTDEITLRTDTYVIIEGGRMHRVIGGGNGEDLSKPAANIFGTANTTVYAGLINEVYGGANRQGSVDAINLTMSNPGNSQITNGCTDQVYGKVFGCANAADYNRSVTTNILCGVGTIGELYGGSNLADIGRLGSINANVTLNLYGGVHSQVFAGSKGDLPSVGGTNKASNIYGNVTLNLFGGVITNAYGGSNYNGNIAGTITVNVLDVVDPTCTSEALDLTNVYGASNMADYEPTYTPASGDERISPVVNVIHIAQAPGIRGDVFGGGNQASVTASPQVNIGYYDATMSSQIPTNYPIAEANRRGYVSGNIFGGGNEAGVTGNPVVNMRDKGTVVTGIYGGCNTNGNVDGDINVNIYGGTMGTSTTARMTDGIFGGGKGHSTETTGNVTVTIGDGTDPTVYADIYGGSAFGEVGAANKLAKVLLENGTVYGTIFGGGKGDGSYAATVSGATEVAIEGGLVRGTVISGSGANAVTGAVFGGCNVNGIVLGNATVSYTGGTIGTTDNHANTYGGGLGPNTKVKGDVDVTVDGSGVNVYGDVYGGSAKGKVNTENGTSQSESSKTDVTLTAGTVHGSLYGGGHGPDGNEAADVYGPITVTVEGGTVTNAFGCNNNSGTPKSTVTVNVTNGTVTNVFGGGNVAAYIPTTNNIDYPAVNIKGGEVTKKVVGGGNAANIGSSTISCNPVVTISGGQVCTATTDAGVYGGCNTSGTVYGNITVNVTNADGNTTISSLEALQAIANANGNPISIHGGGYGHLTSTTGDVTVNFGTATTSSDHTEYPMLYGDMYGGSALGTVNHEVDLTDPTDLPDQTTVNILNGSVELYKLGNTQFGGNIYGGGLGNNDHAATVYGEVHVNIGNTTSSTNPDARFGKPSLIGCNVFGCNNKNGSPQRDVFVDVYQTNHTSTDCVDCSAGDFAINTVYGGGNMADYAPTDNPNLSEPYSLKTHNYIHFCDNTVGTVYGGGRAAYAEGVVTNVDGGRFEYIFGGGNGQIDPADIGWGGINLTVCSGHVGYKYVGCDMGGNVLGELHDNECAAPQSLICNDDLVVDYFFFGANKSTIIGGLVDVIECSSSNPMNYKNVYAGSRLAVIYGDIFMTVRGGTITNLFGGSQGSEDRPGDVRRYPHLNNQAEMDMVPEDAKNDMVTFLTLNEGLQGQGGNIYLKLEGGTITNVYGGNQLYGSVDGDIIVVVDKDPTLACPLVIDTLYGGNEKAIYTPELVSGQPRISPKVYIKDGKVNYDVYGGSFGDRQSQIQNAGRVNSHPYVLIGSDVNADQATVGRNVYGGGSKAEVVGDTKVVLRGKATIGDPDIANSGNVYGGSREGDVDGSTDVQIEPASVNPITIPDAPTPETHLLTFGVNPAGAGSNIIEVTNTHGDAIESGITPVPQGSVLHIRVLPANAGYTFYGWGVTNGAVVQAYEANTTFIMGGGDATLTANFTTGATNYHTLTLAANPTVGGTFKVNGTAYTGPVLIPENFPVTVQAIHAEGYVFNNWTGSSATTSTVTFNMGTTDVSLTANFVPTHTLTLTASPDGACTFKVGDDPYTGSISIREGTTVTLLTIPAEGHEGDSIEWTTDSGTISGDTTSTSITFTMGTGNANVTATFTAPPAP